MQVHAGFLFLKAVAEPRALQIPYSTHTWLRGFGNPKTIIARCCRVLATLLLTTAPIALQAAELLTLCPENAARIGPAGKEVDAAYGDYVMRNNRIVAVVGNPDLNSGRSSSRWATRYTAGCILDLTRRDAPNDQLTAFYPGPTRFKADAPQRQGDFYDEAKRARETARKPVTGTKVTLTLPEIDVVSGRRVSELQKSTSRVQQNPSLTYTLSYQLSDDEAYIRVNSAYRNPTNRALTAPIEVDLRVDRFFERGRGADDRLIWAYDRWFGQAYGVLAMEHTFNAKFQPIVNGATGPLIQPGDGFELEQLLIPGRDLFAVRSVANAVLGIEQLPVKLQIADSAKPLVADVNVFQAGQLYGAGRSAADGRLNVQLPAGMYVLEVEAIGRPTVRQDLEVTGPVSLAVAMEPAATVVARISDERGQPMPCKVAFRGRGHTPDPFFFPKTGEHLVHNLVYSHTGRFRQDLQPGMYRVVISRGPEYDAVMRDIEVAAGQEVALTRQLQRTVDSAGWISADLHSHSTVSGVTERFYVKDYKWDRVVDINSTASQRGRVLNLLAEHIEFAPAAEHNVVSSFQDHLTALNATPWLATCPGIGLTAGRRHTTNHQNVFPLPVDRWAVDGGALQRPEHIGQLTWLHKNWLEEAGHFHIQITQPSGVMPRPARSVDSLEVGSLAPLFGGQADSSSQSAVLQWIKLLDAGYRITGVLNSAAGHNFHGSGGVRNYVRSNTDVPGELAPKTIAAELSAGHVVMTTGPFLRVALHPVSDNTQRALPGDEVSLEDGRGTLQVAVQAPNWIRVDNVRVLVNGATRSDLCFTREQHASMFSEGPTQFSSTIPLALTEDSHLIVTVEGTGENLRADWRARPRTPQYAVANPIFVDVGSDGYRPHSPLDDKVTTRIEWLRPVLAAPDAPPGKVRVHFENNGGAPMRDTAVLEIKPKAAGRVVPVDNAPYSVDAGQHAASDFDVYLSPAYLAQGLPIITHTYVQTYLSLRVPRSANGVGQRPARSVMKVDHPAQQLRPIDQAVDARAALRDAVAYPLHNRRVGDLGTARFAVAADKLLLHAEVTDPRITRKAKRPWAGSCVEVFGAMPRRKPIGRVILLPQADGRRASGKRLRNGVLEPLADVDIHSRDTVDGYQLSAIIPLSHLRVDPSDGRILLEIRVSAARDAHGTFARGTIFWSGAPEVDHNSFGRIRLADRVGASFAVKEPVMADPRARPGLVHMTLRNHSSLPAEDTATIRIRTKGAVKVKPDVVPFSLAPGEEQTVVLSVTNGGLSAGSLKLYVPRSPLGAILRSPDCAVRLHGRTIHRLTEIPAAAAVASVLAAWSPSRIYHEKAALGDVWLALAGGVLVVAATVIDASPTSHEVAWKGSCLEIFGSRLGTDEIGQVLLVPAVGDKPAHATRVVNADIVPAPGVELRSSPTSMGYLLQALVPLEMLALGPNTGRQILLEMQLHAASKDGARTVFRRGTLFGSQRAYKDNRMYGLLEVVNE